MKAKFITFVRGLKNGTPPRFQSYLKSLTLLLAMVVSVNVWGAEYTKVTSAPTDWSGKYLVAYVNGTSAYVYKGTDAANNGMSATISNNKITKADGMAEIEIASMTGGYSLKVVGGTNNGKYLSGGTSNGTTFNTNAVANSISLNTDGTVKINNNTTTSFQFNSASDQQRFRYFKSAQKGVCLFKAPSGYTIDFDCNGATSGCPSQLTNKTNLPNPLPTTQQKTGYNFFKWYTNSGLTAMATAGAAITANTTLYAKWNIISRTVTYNGDGQLNYTAKPTNATIEDAGIEVAFSVNTGYEITGVSVTMGGTSLVENTDFTWDQDDVTIMPDDGNGITGNIVITFTTELVQTCTNEITISKSNTTLPSGCSFELDKTEGCGDNDGETVVVTCSPATHYTVTAVNSESGTPGAISNNKCTISGIKTNTIISVTFTEDTKYTITFVDAVHGESVAPKSVYENETFTFPSITDKTAVAPTGDCVADHYHFIGWVEEGTTPTQSPSNVITAGTTSTQITKSVTYKAVWAKEEL